MRRRYRRELYQEKVAKIKSLIPHCGIGVDVITGFPSESDDDFQETYNFLSGLDVTYFHVFTYSERSHTKALEIQPVVPINIRHERTRILRSLSYKKIRQFEKENMGTTRKVLFEGMHGKGLMEGYTDNYIKISIPYHEAWSNNIVDWKI